MFSSEAKPAPKNDPNVLPKLFMDMNRAKRVPSIPGGQSCPERIRKGINLHITKNHTQKNKTETARHDVKFVKELRRVSV